jgi:hypothetical protein
VLLYSALFITVILADTFLMKWLSQIIVLRMI